MNHPYRLLGVPALLLLLLLAACGPGGAAPSATRAPATAQPTGASKTAPPASTPADQPDSTVVPLEREIRIDQPVAGQAINSPVRVSGFVSVSPFEATLNGRVYAADGALLGEAGIMVQAEPGKPGMFEGEIPFNTSAGVPARVEVAELSAKDGAVVVSASVPVSLAVVQRQITIAEPVAGATISSPLRVSGSYTVWPFEATLNAIVYGPDGSVIGRAIITVAGPMGQPGDFVGEVSFDAGSGGPGRVEVIELGAKDGEALASASVDVQLAPGQGPSGSPELIQIPQAGSRITLPLNVLARLGEPGQRAQITLRWQNGVELTGVLPVVEAPDGGPLIIGSIDWQTESQPPQPIERAATLEIVAGGERAEIALEVLRWDDPEVQPVDLYWTIGEEYVPGRRQLVRGPRVGLSALEQLLWGPSPNNMAGFESALPTPQEVLNFPGRQADWGPRVRVLDLVIEDGVATANFSKELNAYGGGSARVERIRQQIELTLKQFPSVNEVVIAIEGQSEGVLQP